MALEKAVKLEYIPKNPAAGSELPKLEQAIVKESGSSVLLVVANDSQAAQAALDGLAQ